MKTFADVKRRIKTGTRLLCVENTYRPILNGTSRVVVKPQTNGFFWDCGLPGDRRSWTPYPKASAVRVVDADTFEMTIGKMNDREVIVRLRFEN